MISLRLMSTGSLRDMEAGEETQAMDISPMEQEAASPEAPAIEDPPSPPREGECADQHPPRVHGGVGTEGLRRQLLSLGPGESHGRWVSAVCELEVQPQAKVTEAWVGNIQSKARPQEKSQPLTACLSL